MLPGVFLGGGPMWLRFDVEIFDCPDTHALSKELKISRYEAAALWLRLQSWCRKFCVTGNISKVDQPFLEQSIGFDGLEGTLIHALQKTGWVNPDGWIKNWHKWGGAELWSLYTNHSKSYPNLKPMYDYYSGRQTTITQPPKDHQFTTELPHKDHQFTTELPHKDHQFTTELPHKDHIDTTDLPPRLDKIRLDKIRLENPCLLPETEDCDPETETETETETEVKGAPIEKAPDFAQELTIYFADQWAKANSGNEMTIQWGKHKKIFKTLLSAKGKNGEPIDKVEDLKELINFFFSNYGVDFTLKPSRTIESFAGKINSIKEACIKYYKGGGK
jgi:hypothetical protein